MIIAQHIISPEEGMDEGRYHALQYCQSCHLFVEPELLSKRVWTDFVVPRMGGFLGMHNAGYDYSFLVAFGETEEAQETIRQANVYPTTPIVPNDQWDLLAEYLISNAPEEPIPPEQPLVLRMGLDQFRTIKWNLPRAIPTTSLVEIDEERRQVLIGDMIRGSLSIIGFEGNLIQEFPTGTAPVAVRRTEHELWVTTIGSFFPSDLQLGEMIIYEEVDGVYRFFPGNRKLHRLRRPTATSYGDFNKDGVLDIMMSEYGHQVGQFTYYEGLKNREYTAHVLGGEPGTMMSRVYDFNDDGWDDVAVVQGQNREGIHIYYNMGDGTFKASYAVQVPVCYGSAYFDLYDFNEDGYMDILAAHGDNADYPPELKRFHGLRIYLNDGNNAFEESFFFHLNGAFKAIPNDYDDDGDLDIAAISMFPDFDHQPEEGFIYLRNLGDFRFEAYTIPEADEGRWLTMDAGDLDGDGDQDIVIGSFTMGPTPAPEALLEKWQDLKQPVLYLENRLR